MKRDFCRSVLGRQGRVTARIKAEEIQKVPTN